MFFCYKFLTKKRILIKNIFLFKKKVHAKPFITHVDITFIDAVHNITITLPLKRGQYNNAKQALWDLENPFFAINI